MKYDRPAVIMGLAPDGLAAVRTLRSMGVPCLGMCFGARYEIGRQSKYLIRACQVSPASSHDELLAALDELILPWKGSSPILIPASDVYARFIDEKQDELRPRYTFRCSRSRLHSTFIDKAKTIGLCLDHGVPIPRSTPIVEPEQVSTVCRDFRFPVIVKPALVHGVNFPGKNFVASSAAELASFFEGRPDLVGKTVSQEVVRGGDGRIIVFVSYSGREGKVLARMTLRKIRQWHPDYGVTCFGRSEFLSGPASIAERFLNELGYQGFAAIEFTEEEGTGHHFLLEVNPRLGLPTQLALDANVDIVRTAYLEMCQAVPSRAAPPRQIDGVYWIDFRFDVLSFVEKYREGRISLLEWLRSVFRASSYAVYDRRDLNPFFASSHELVRDLFSRLKGWLRGRLQSLQPFPRRRAPR